MKKISEAVKQDHTLIKRVYRRLSDANPEDRNPDEFIWVLDRYLMVEDLVVMPALDSHIAHGGERHHKLSADYDSIHEKLLHMKKYNPAEPSFESSLKAIWVDLEPHIREETTGDLTRLEESLSQSDSEALAKKYEDIKELLQKPYGENGTPDARTLSAILGMPRQELLVKLGIREE
ncbi:DNA nickase [Madurella fahalii]|uniref:DNA nickase n=1 Tax=Madurella fahalii TaxID=1157608 RepID=A0ABQ0GKN9_9PEZI